MQASTRASAAGGGSPGGVGILVAVACLFSGCVKTPATLPNDNVLASPAIEVWLGGDVNLGEGGKGALAQLAEPLRGASGIVNLEGPVSAAPPPGEGLRLFNTPAAVKELQVPGIAVAGIANNHAGDAGPGGPAETVRALLAAGVLPAGGIAKSVVLEREGIRISITAHDLTDGLPSGLEADLLAARMQGDALIATFHVSDPPLYLPSNDLRLAVELALQAGALVVAAHGSHAIGPVERRGPAVIAWGLGNLVFSCNCTDEDDAIVLRVGFEGSHLAGVTVIPIEAGLNGLPAHLARDPMGMFDLLEAIGTPSLRREGHLGRL